uniref:Uncharacterized protein n=1 Tax=Rhizophora mucronata TaxID=61149 RepID=A0A2P2QYI7_RHIMU
METMTSAS